jgi:RNA polymerase sigma factor (TIGR02999 family)
LAELNEITGLLRRWEEGDPSALDQLMPLMYERLRELARRRLKSEPDASLNTTGLVHEAYLKLAASPGVHVQDRGHFVGLASRVMRHLLVDYARARKAAKRGSGMSALEFTEATWIPDDSVEPVLKLDEALQRLATVDERRSRMLELRYFGGLSLEETAEALDVSLATVKRELRAARAWLAVVLGPEAS